MTTRLTTCKLMTYRISRRASQIQYRSIIDLYWSRITRHVLIGLVLSTVPCCGAEAKGTDFTFTILHTNDLHAHDQTFKENGKSVGGLARIGHVIRELRSKDQNPVVVDAGDIFQGTPLYSLKHGEVEVNLLNKIGFDLAALGNHEFDDGPENLARQLKLATYPVICANLDFAAVPKLAALVTPSLIKQIGGQKVGFVGAITPEISRGSITLGGVKVKSPAAWMQPIEDEVKKLQDQGVNKIVVVSHCGIEADRQLAEKIPDIDIIVGGHSHTRLEKPVIIDHSDGSCTFIVQTGCYGRAIGELVVAFDKDGKILKQESHEHLIDITANEIEDPDLQAYVSEQSKPLAGRNDVVVAQAAKSFGTDFNSYHWDSAIGDLLCDALYEEGKKYGATISLQNRGGIRSHIESGPISLRTINEVLSFDNTLIVATIDGATLLRSIENGLAGYLGARFLEVHGIKFGYDAAKPVGEKIVFALAQDEKGDWQPIKPSQDYRVAINSYNFKSGEGHDFSKAKNVQYTEVRLSSIFEQYLRAQKTVTPQPPSRIVALTDGILSTTDKPNRLRIRSLANSRLTLLAGRSQGVDSMLDGIPVPLLGSHIVATMECQVRDTFFWDLKSNNEEGCWFAVVVQPRDGGTPIISYPIPRK